MRIFSLLLLLLVLWAGAATARRGGLLGKVVVGSIAKGKIDDKKKELIKSKLQQLLEASGTNQVAVIRPILGVVPVEVLSKETTWAPFGESPLHRAAANDRNLDAFKLLYPKMPSLLTMKDKLNRTVLEEALEHNSTRIIGFLGQQNSQVVKAHKSEYNRSILHVAAANGDLDLVKAAVQSGIDVSTKSSIADMFVLPIHLAARYGHLDVVKFFIEQQPNLANAKDRLGSLPIHRAAEGGHQEIVEFFLERGINVNVQQDGDDCKFRICGTPLHLASANDHLDLVKFLVSKEADVNAKAEATAFQWLPIHMAAFGGHLPVVEYFVTLNAELCHAEDVEGSWPIHLAARGGSADVVIYFLGHNVSVDQRQRKYAQTSLHIAAFYGRVNVTKALCENGADVNATSGFVINNIRSDMLPVHLAAFQGQLAVVKFLVETYPEQRLIKDKTGKTALNWAEFKGGIGNKKVAAWLKSVA